MASAASGPQRNSALYRLRADGAGRPHPVATETDRASSKHTVPGNAIDGAK